MTTVEPVIELSHQLTEKTSLNSVTSINYGTEESVTTSSDVEISIQ